MEEFQLMVSGKRAYGPVRWSLGAMLLLATGCGTVSERKPVGSLLGDTDALAAAYEETFASGQATAWRMDVDTAWRVEAERLQVTAAGDETRVALHDGVIWTNLLLDVDYSRAELSAGAGGVVVRATADFQGWTRGSGYLFSLGTDGASWQYAVYRQVDGVIAYLQSWTPIPSIDAQSNRIGVLARGNLLQLYLNRKLVWEGRDVALSEGVVGLLGSASPGQEARHVFDNLSIKVVPPPKSGEESAKTAAPVVEDKSPRLRPGLLVRVTVYVSGRREIDAEVKRVSDNNQLDLPLIGPVSVANMTLAQLNAVLQTRYQDYFIEPQALAEFVVEERPDAISPWGSVVVLGRVRTPGRVNIPPTQDLTISGAIQQAGGLDTSARASAIRLTRRKPDGKMERIGVDLTAIGTRGDVENDLILKPGDVVFVPESVF